MPGDIISMDDMEGVFSVTDAFGISREAVAVPLGKEDPGSVTKVKGGLEIAVPKTVPLEDFLHTLEDSLRSLGYSVS